MRGSSELGGDLCYYYRGKIYNKENDKRLRKLPKVSFNDIVEIIARNYGDIIIGTKRVQADGVHPSTAGYREIAEKTKKEN